MSGRRMRKAINATLQSVGMPDGTQVVIAGLANTYSDYIVTYEEYQVRKKGTIENDNSRFFDSQVQRYEGASTVYGQYTLDAYMQLYTALAEALAGVKRENARGIFPRDNIFLLGKTVAEGAAARESSRRTDSVSATRAIRSRR